MISKCYVKKVKLNEFVLKMSNDYDTISMMNLLTFLESIKRNLRVICVIGVSIADSSEWKVILNYYNIDYHECKKFPFGEYFKISLYNKELLFYSCDIRKVKSSASTQYMIDHFDLKKIIVVGTCAGIDSNYDKLDVFFSK